MNEEVLLSGLIGAHATIRDVRLRSVSATLPDAADPSAITIDFSIETECNLPTPDVAQFFVRFRVAGDGGEAMEIAGQLELLYDLPEADRQPQEVLAAFEKVSVVFSAYPYIRELVQSLTVRAGLSPLVLTTLRAPIDLDPEAEEDDSEEAEPEASESKEAEPSPE